MNWFDSNNCGHSMHTFARDAEGHVQAYHTSDDQLCESAEFNFSEMLRGDVEPLVSRELVTGLDRIEQDINKLKERAA